MPTAELDRQLAVRIPSSLLNRLAALARTGDRTLAHEVRRALREHVEREAGTERRVEAGP